jgi:hypothetical protein
MDRGLTVGTLRLDGVLGLGGEGLPLLVDGGHLEPVEVARLQVLHRALHRGGVHLHHTVQFTSGQILSPADWGDIVDSGIELSYRHTRLTDIEENKIQMGSKLYEENFLSFFIIAHIGWQAGTITLCQSQLYPPVRD